MTTPSLERAIALATDLPEDGQNAIAEIILDELDEQRWDELFAKSVPQLKILAARALAAREAGATLPFPDDDD